MSALAPAHSRPAAARGRSHATPARTAPARTTPARPALRLVPYVRSTARRLPFVVLVGSILSAGLVSLLMLHTLAAQDAFTLHSLQRHAAALADTEQQLAVADQQAAAPTALAARARSLGLVPARSLKITKRRNGTVVAVVSAGAAVTYAPAGPAGTPATAKAKVTPATPAAKPSAKASAKAPATTKPRPHHH